ncbi:MAG: dihydroorotate dehydrogenase [Desulfobacterales bacterium]|nr:dihydroorotate dehydrogenase [Desulfobacterales bacterium]
MEKEQIDISVNIGGIKLKNPVMTASGTFGYGIEFKDIFDLNCLGGIITKGISLNPSAGNPPPRIVETSCGMLNAIGLENVGFDNFVKDKIPFLKTLSCPFFVNIYGKSIEEYGELAEKFNDIEEVKGIEVNISCPNVKEGGIVFGTDPSFAYKVIETVRKKTSKPLMAKLSPNVTDITVIARSVEDAGADSVSLINTLTGMAIDIETKKPKLKNITGGLSGPAIKPIAIRMVWQTAKAVKIPIIGIGGIINAEDALEFIIAGASAVQVGTANFINPRASFEIIDGIKDFLLKKKINSIQSLIGSINYA